MTASRQPEPPAGGVVARLAALGRRFDGAPPETMRRQVAAGGQAAWFRQRARATSALLDCLAVRCVLRIATVRRGAPSGRAVLLADVAIVELSACRRRGLAAWSQVGRDERPIPAAGFASSPAPLPIGRHQLS